MSKVKNYDGNKKIYCKGILIIAIMTIVSNCQPPELDNPCDLNSKSYLKALYVKAILDDLRPHCDIDYLGRGTNPISIANFSAPSGHFGTIVTITGTGFSMSLASNIVKFNGVIATVNSASATSLTASVPAGAGLGIISVEANGQSANSSSSFSYIYTVYAATNGGVSISTNGGTSYTNTAASGLGHVNVLGVYAQ